MKKSLEIEVGCLPFIIVLAVFGILLWAFDAKAHGWFEQACCHDKDCKQISETELTREGDKLIWQSARSGARHVINVNAVSPVDKKPRIRPSQDSNFWGCEENLADRPQDPPLWKAYCVYIPELY